MVLNGSDIRQSIVGRHLVVIVMAIFCFSNAELHLFQEVFLNVAAITWNSLYDVPNQPYEVRKGVVEIF